MGPPSSWLKGFNAGIPGLPNGSIDFVSGKIVPFVIGLLIFILVVASLIFLIVGGIMWITSSGDKERTAKAKSAVTYAIIGLVLGLGSFIILNILGLIFGVNLTGP